MAHPPGYHGETRGRVTLHVYLPEVCLTSLRMKQFHNAHNVRVFFPPESAEQSSVLLVYDPLSPLGSPEPVEKEKHLNEVVAKLLEMAKDAADVKSELISVEKRWHDVVVGKDGTTLNA